MRFRFFLVSLTLIILFNGAEVISQEIQHPQIEAAVQHLMQTPGMESVRIGLFISDLTNTEQVFSLHSDQLFTPASNVKLFTTAMGLEVLGTDFRWTTTAKITGRLKNNGTLVGDLLISGNGDPTFSSMCLNGYNNNIFSLYTFLQLQQIKKIKGGVYLGNTENEQPVFPANWLCDDLKYYWGSGVYNFNYNDNSRFYNADYPNVRIYDTTGISSNTITLSDPDPWESFTIALTDTLKEKAIAIRYDRKLTQTPVIATYEMYSPTLDSMVREINVESRNMWAEALLLAIGKEMGLEKDFERAADTVQEYWSERLGLEQSLFLYDGSGLSPYDAVTPEMMVKLLEYMALKSPEGATFISSLPEMGKEGTVKRLEYHNDLYPVILAKSGSFTRVRNYSGYILDYNGIPKYAFSLMMNGFTCTHEELKAKTGIFFSELFYDVLK